MSISYRKSETLNLSRPLSKPNFSRLLQIWKRKKFLTPFASKHITIHSLVRLLEPRSIHCRRVCMFDGWTRLLLLTSCLSYFVKYRAFLWLQHQQYQYGKCIPSEHRHNMNNNKAFRRGLRRLLNVFSTFNLHPVSREYLGRVAQLVMVLHCIWGLSPCYWP